MARSVRRKVEGKRWNERALKMVTGTPWNPLPGQLVVRRRYITQGFIERYSPSEDCGASFRKSQQHSERCRRGWPSRGQSPGGVARSPALPDPAAPNLVSTSTAAQAGGVDTDGMQTEDIEPAVSSSTLSIGSRLRQMCAALREVECYHTSRKCEGLKNVPMDAIRKNVRVCIAYNETDNEVGKR